MSNLIMVVPFWVKDTCWEQSLDDFSSSEVHLLGTVLGWFFTECSSVGILSTGNIPLPLITANTERLEVVECRRSIVVACLPGLRISIRSSGNAFKYILRCQH
jgi:hypothetical protein